ncbi:peptide ABC transporter permease [Streptomyces pluripotens]|uniref:Peptide ABC transporter permease n=1 Tax=Streptomyces pluripotens TaxID=1355015 RepID=A0A221NV95_9ACTN|nr:MULTISPECIES: FtsX-like permease family protein [Streptomyces]ARP69673.1 peptide ABC transporter permease [Streptomyces pluripotens]ASN23929.1 peptide ABC transporter permease [Streptomyces pluripotens]MCH0558567.1 FtsX-like permease family protein [Streptomyces sp. MUM 16J]
MRATLRWAHSDLRTHRGEALFLVLATAGIVASLLLATALFGYATNPWQRVFTQARGAHVWIHTSLSADARALARLDGVESVAGPYRTESATVASRGTRVSVELRGTPRLPSVSRPLLTTGHWLDAAEPNGVVLESSLARALLAEPGDTLTLPGTTRTLTVEGIADSAEPHYSPGERPGLVWALPAAVRAPAGQVIGLRLGDPADTDYIVQRAVTALGSGAVGEVSTWRQARSAAQGDNRLLGQVLGLFGLGALVAAGFAVHGAIATRIRGHLRDLSILKAIGFTPGQVVRVFLLQHLAYALLGSVAAAALTEALGSRIPGRLGDAVGVWQGLPGHALAVLAVPVGAVLFIGLTTGLAAWRAGRVPPVPVPRPAAPAGGRLTGPARRALGLRWPAALVLGCHKVFTGRGRSLATVARLTLPLLLIVVALSAWTTIDRFHSSPGQMGLPTALTVRSDGALRPTDVQALLMRDSRVAAAYPGVEEAALVPGQTGTIALRGIGTRAEPYPYTLAEGHAARGPDEAVAGQGLLDLLHARVGDWVRMTVGDRPQILHIVGRSIEPRNAGRVATTSLDTLRENDPGLSAAFYELRLRPGADPQLVAAALAAAGAGHLDVHPLTNPADGLSPLRAVVAGLIAVLALIGLVELLTAIGASVREGERDLLALRAIGMSPRQITAITVTATGCTTLVAVVAGTALGLPLARRLIDAQGSSGGIGAGIAQSPSPGLLLLLSAAAVLGAAALAALPAARATRRRLADTLSAVA